METKKRALVHYGVKGMKWGVRRWVNKDGTLTDRGKKRAKKVRESRVRSAIDAFDAKRIMRYNILKNYLLMSISKKPYKVDAYQAKVLGLKTNLIDIKSGRIQAGKDFLISRLITGNYNKLTYIPIQSYDE